MNKAHSKLDEIQSSINTTNANLKNHYKDFSQYGQRINQRNVNNIESLNSTYSILFKSLITNIANRALGS